MRVGILSMQRIFNYGSFLQAYALKNMLMELGCEVQFVDYHPGKCLIQSESGTGVYRKIFKILEVLKIHSSLKEKIRFIKYKKDYAANYYPYLGINNHMNYSPQLDVLVIGSDEVFNCVQNNTNVGFAPELFGANQNAKKVISYAASFGNTTIEKLKQYGVKNEVARLLKNFSAISVRDANSKHIVETLTSKTPVCNLDPVLMYDYIGKCKEASRKVNESNYIILYGYSGRFTKKECAAIRAFADKYKLKVLCIGGIQDCCDKFIDCSPFKVISYFKNAKYVITDTFHGSIISIITHQRFVSLVRKSGYGNSEKLMDLLQRLHLKERIIKNMNNLDEMLHKDFSYEETDSIIQAERKNAYKYLKSQIFQGE